MPESGSSGKPGVQDPVQQEDPSAGPLTGASDANQHLTPDGPGDLSPIGQKNGPQLNAALIKAWMDDDGWTNETLAQRLKISDRAISSMRNNGEYHGSEAVAKLANLMDRDAADLYLP